MMTTSTNFSIWVVLLLFLAIIGTRAQVPSESTPSPSSDMDTPSPSADVATPSPSSDADTPSPSADVATPSPSSDVDIPSPSADVTTPSPSSDMDTPSPSADVTTSSPSSDMDTPSPSADVTTPSPSSDMDILSPSVNMDTPSPSLDVATPSPSEEVIITILNVQDCTGTTQNNGSVVMCHYATPQWVPITVAESSVATHLANGDVTVGATTCNTTNCITCDCDCMCTVGPLLSPSPSAVPSPIPSPAVVPSPLVVPSPIPSPADVPSPSVCVPDTCDSLGYACLADAEVVPNGCGGYIYPDECAITSCPDYCDLYLNELFGTDQNYGGSCNGETHICDCVFPSPQPSPSPEACTPLTCEDYGYDCLPVSDALDDGCGGFLYWTDCPSYDCYADCGSDQGACNGDTHLCECPAPVPSPVPQPAAPTPCPAPVPCPEPAPGPGPVPTPSTFCSLVTDDFCFTSVEYSSELLDYSIECCVDASVLADICALDTEHQKEQAFQNALSCTLHLDQNDPDCSECPQAASPPPTPCPVPSPPPPPTPCPVPSPSYPLPAPAPTPASGGDDLSDDGSNCTLATCSGLCYDAAGPALVASAFLSVESITLPPGTPVWNFRLLLFALFLVGVLMAILFVVYGLGSSSSTKK